MISKMMHQICYGFYWNIKKWSKLGQKIDFWLILWVLILFMLPYILRVIPQDFAKWKTLLRYISMVSFISIAFVVEKLRIFKVFHIDSAFMKWFLLGFFLTLTPANICWNISILLKFWPEVFSNKKNTVIEKSFKILNFDSHGTHPWFTVLVHLGAQFTTRKPNILLKTKISCINYILRNIK